MGEDFDFYNLSLQTKTKSIDIENVTLRKHISRHGKAYFINIVEQVIALNNWNQFDTICIEGDCGGGTFFYQNGTLIDVYYVFDK
jgi:hypothetical protein